MDMTGEQDADRRYRAVSSRDARFDGQFFFAVTSTGIFCRPSCPARTPARQNIRYFASAAAASRAGFRACRRCLPETVPGPPTDPAQVAGRALRLIDDGYVDRHSVPRLAAELGYTPRHLGRILETAYGASALDLARVRRAQLARELLLGTRLRSADIAYAAGFGSIRQFNDTIRAVFDLTPTQLRERAHRSATRTRGENPDPLVDPNGGGPAGLRLQVDLPLRPPYDAPGIMDFLEHRTIAGVEAIDRSADRLRYSRTLLLPGGPGAIRVEFARASATPGHWRAAAELELPRLADLGPATARIRRLFDLDADAPAIDAALGRGPLAAQVVARPGIRIPGAVDPMEITARAIVGQQISVAAAAGHLSRLTTVLGEPYTGGFPELSAYFPSAAALASGLPEAVPGHPDPDRPLRLPARPINTLRRLACALSTGALPTEGRAPDQLRDELLAHSGIGEWTTEYIVMRLTGDPDAWPVGDLHLRGIDPRGFAPWRSYAALHIWQRAAAGPGRSPRRSAPSKKDE
ncbi:helix-turn-helix domain-containing protein [Brevibacterium sp. 50QC2O2]|nr:helix-turn-helix domain-containing protein [Brevibacterium sp. 68QC2CO]MCQ9388884.1 helix-turn-helix domain-containing protein [Brevibacterium sp. 50QC2O2]